mgnify:FL=1
MTEETASEIMSKVTHYLKYAKYKHDEQKKETWEETVNRNREMHLKKFGHLGPEVYEGINRIYDDFVMTKKIIIF